MNIYLISVLVLVALLVIWLRVIANKKHERVMKELKQLAAENDAEIECSEYWSGLHSQTKIGFDKKRLKLFFIRTVNNSTATLMVDMREVKRVTKRMQYRTVSEGKEVHSVVDSIGLSLAFVDSKRKEVYLEFFNTDYDALRVNGEIQTAEKWEDILAKAVGK